MLTVETIGRIRREHFIKGKTIREISRDLKVSRNTVRKVLRSGETSFEYERDVQPRPKLGRWTSELMALEAIDAGAFSRAPPLPEKFWRHNGHGKNGNGGAQGEHRSRTIKKSPALASRG